LYVLRDFASRGGALEGVGPIGLVVSGGVTAPFTASFILIDFEEGCDIAVIAWVGIMVILKKQSGTV
jgi:hypothetical protein